MKITITFMYNKMVTIATQPSIKFGYKFLVSEDDNENIIFRFIHDLMNKSFDKCDSESGNLDATIEEENFVDLLDNYADYLNIKVKVIVDGAFMLFTYDEYRDL